MKSTATSIIRRLQSAGYEAFWVGGCVRDFLLGREPSDYDIATSAKPDEVEALFTRTIPVGKQFGIIMVVEEEQPFEVATFRAEANYEDGRRPSHVEFANAEADALRRDFTVNGLFYDPIAEKAHDWVGGEADLDARVIRTIGRPEGRFAEDHLRLLRAVRFAAQLEFEIEPETFRQVRELAPKIQRISAERIQQELVKLFRPPHAERGLLLLRGSGLLDQVLPEIAAMQGCEQSPEYHPEGDVFEHLRLMLRALPGECRAELPWAVLLHDVGKPATASRDEESGRIHFYAHEKVGEEIARDILARLRFPSRQMDDITFAVKHHMQFKDVPKMRKATLRRMLLRPTFPLELELHRLDCMGSHGKIDIYDFLVAQAEELANKPEILPPLLTGHDLISLGMKEGPEIGRLLEELRDVQLQEEITSREAALVWAADQVKSA